MTQSGANPSPSEFPAIREKYRESLVFETDLGADRLKAREITTLSERIP